MGFYYFVTFSEEYIIDINSPEIKSLQKELDSLRQIEIASRKPKKYPFNPNFITDFKGYTLGMSTEEIDRLHKFRQQDNWVNSVEDFQNVTKVSDTLLKVISPYFKFPDWVSEQQQNKNLISKENKDKSRSQKKDLNKVTIIELQQINGIGATLSDRILKYRDKLGGFTNESQVYQIYGLSDKVIQNILKEFTVKTPKVINKMNLNKISASDIATIPGISFELAKKIWEYRILNEGIEYFSELGKIEGLTQRKLEVIQLYLAIE